MLTAESVTSREYLISRLNRMRVTKSRDGRSLQEASHYNLFMTYIDALNDVARGWQQEGEEGQ